MLCVWWSYTFVPVCELRMKRRYFLILNRKSFLFWKTKRVQLLSFNWWQCSHFVFNHLRNASPLKDIKEILSSQIFTLSRVSEGRRGEQPLTFEQALVNNTAQHCTTTLHILENQQIETPNQVEIPNPNQAT